MTDITFPLTGGWATLALGLEFVIVFSAVEVMVFFIIDYMRGGDAQKKGRNLAWAPIILAIGIIYMFYIYTDFQIHDPLERDRLLQYSYVAFAVCAVATTLLTEILEHIRIRILSAISISILVFIFLGVFMLSRTILMTIATVLAVVLAVLFFIVYFYRLLKLTNFSRTVMKPIIGFLGIMSLVLVGILPSGDMVVNMLGIWSRPLGDLIIICCLPIFVVVLQKLPHLGEFDWKEKIRAVIVYNENGIALFSHFFGVNPESRSANEQLISASLTSIQQMFSKLEVAKRMKVVDMAEKFVFFEAENNFNFVVISDENLYSLQIRLKQFSQQFSEIYVASYKNWDGSVSQFDGAQLIFQKIFATVNQSNVCMELA